MVHPKQITTIRQGEKCPEAVWEALKISPVLTLGNSRGETNPERRISHLAYVESTLILKHMDLWSSTVFIRMNDIV